MKTLQVTQAKTTKPQAIQHIKQKPQIDTDPIADATLSAQNQASISVSVTVKGMDVAKPSRKRIKCTCPNCVKGEHHPDPRRLHICHIVGCNKAYVKPVSLRLHMRGRHTGISSPHSGERPFKCSWVSCDKRLTSHRHLLNHTRIHVDQNRFQCIQCSMKFTRSDHLSRHMWTHVRIKKDFPHSQVLYFTPVACLKIIKNISSNMFAIGIGHRHKIFIIRQRWWQRRREDDHYHRRGRRWWQQLQLVFGNVQATSTQASSKWGRTVSAQLLGNTTVIYIL